MCAALLPMVGFCKIFILGYISLDVKYFFKHYHFEYECSAQLFAFQLKQGRIHPLMPLLNYYVNYVRTIATKREQERKCSEGKLRRFAVYYAERSRTRKIPFLRSSQDRVLRQLRVQNWEKYSNLY